MLTPPVYEAKAIITPASQQNAPSGMGVLGDAVWPSCPNQSSVTEIVNLLNSNILREKVIKKNNLLPVLLGTEAKNKKIVQKIKEYGMPLRALQGILKISYKQKDNIIEISAQFNDPDMAVKIINYTVTELTEHMSSETRRVVED